MNIKTISAKEDRGSLPGNWGELHRSTSCYREVVLWGAGSVSGKIKGCVQMVLFNLESLVGAGEGLSAGTQGEGSPLIAVNRLRSE